MIQLDTLEAVRAWLKLRRAQQPAGDPERRVYVLPYDVLEVRTKAVPCSDCGARIGEFCTSETGLMASAPHTARLRRFLELAASE